MQMKKVWAFTVTLNLMSTILLATAQNDIRQPPVITEPVSSMDRFFPPWEKQIVLNCSATGTPSPSFDWYLNMQPIRPGLGDIQVDHSTGMLSILNPDQQIEGSYTCRAKSTFQNGVSAVSVSPPVEVIAARMDPWPDKSAGETKWAKEGEYAYFTCDDNRPVSVGATSVKWYKNVDNVQVEVREDRRVFIDTQGTLHFTYVTVDDTNPEYACGLSNIIVGTILTGRRNQLTVSSASPIPEARPVLRFSSSMGGDSALTFEVNGRGRLECFYSGHVNEPDQGIPVIEWFDNANNQITDGQDRYSIRASGRVLFIDSLREADEKLFTCKASNRLGTERATMMLNVTSPPMWMEPLESPTVPQGSDAVLECQTRSAVGEAAPSPPVWYRNGVSLKNGYDPQKYEFSNGERTLRIKNTMKDADIACFQCFVSNSVGTTFGSACLNVILPISIITRPPPEQTIAKGDIVNLTVVATSDPLYPVSYRWRFNNVTYASFDAPPHVTYDVTSKLAYINTSVLTQEEVGEVRGVYRREVYHKFQRLFVDVEVMLEGDAGAILGAGAGFAYWIVGLVIALLIIFLIIFIVLFVLIRRKIQEGHYPVDKNETKAGLDPEKELKDRKFGELSRAEMEYPDKEKLEKELSIFDLHDLPLEKDDESFGSAEYDQEDTFFNEDGSFIGIYTVQNNTTHNSSTLANGSVESAV